MKVYLIFDLDNLTQHELMEVAHDEESAQTRVDELNYLKNKNNESASWIWDAREVGGFLGDAYVVDIEGLVPYQHAVRITMPDDSVEESAATSDVELVQTIGRIIVDDLVTRRKEN